MVRIMWKKYGRVAVYIDNANIIHSPSRLGWYIGLQKLSLFFKRSKAAAEMALWPVIGELHSTTIAFKMGLTNTDSGAFQSVYPESWFEEIQFTVNVDEQSYFFPNLRFGCSLLWIKS